MSRAAWLGLLLPLSAPAAVFEDFPHVQYGDGVLLDLRVPAAIEGDVEAGRAQATVCAGCHGADGISPVAAFPSIAGQHAAYTYWQLVAYWLRAAPDQPMTPVLQPLDEKDLRDLAAFYASIEPGPPATAPPVPMQGRAAHDDAVREGAALYARGDAARGIVPCQGCHGADARGVAALPASFPRLRAQNRDWLVHKLVRYRAGQDIDSTQDLVMQQVAARLDDEDIAALAAYLASLSRRRDR